MTNIDYNNIIMNIRLNVCKLSHVDKSELLRIITSSSSDHEKVCDIINIVYDIGVSDGKEIGYKERHDEWMLDEY